MAGVPAAVVERARTLVDAAANGDATQPTLSAYADGETAGAGDSTARNGESGSASDREATLDAGGSAPSRNGESVEPGSGDGRVADGDDVDTRLADRLRAVDLGRTTPIEALNLLAELKRDVDQ
jgi:DNA mismatch repair protein MutS